MKIKALLFFLVFIPQYVLAAADIKFSEQRIVFEGKKRTGKLTIINQGDTAATAQLVFKKLIFKSDEPNGIMYEYDYEYNEYPYNVDVLSMLKFSPRKIFLEPGKKQAFRIFLKKPQDLPDGEYRVFVFLDVQEEQQELKAGDIQAPQDDKIGVGISFKTSYGITVVVQHGELTRKIEDIKDISFAELPFEQKSKIASHELRLTYVSDSNSIAYGFINIYGMDGDKEVFLAKKPISIYPDNKEQIAKYVFLPKKGLDKFQTFKLKVVDSKETSTYIEKTFNFGL